MVWARGCTAVLDNLTLFLEDKGGRHAVCLVDMLQPQQVSNQVQQQSGAIPVYRLVFERPSRLSAPRKK